MNNTINQNNKLARAIMRRVWYTYSLQVVFSINTLWGFAFGSSLIGFWKLVSVTSIISNLLSVKVGDAPFYIVQALLQAQTLALIAFGVIVFTLLTVGFRFTLPVIVRGHNLSSV